MPPAVANADCLVIGPSLRFTAAGWDSRPSAGFADKISVFRKIVLPKNSTISVVDDDEGARQSLDSLLRSAGYRVALFTRAEEYLRSAQRAGGGCVVTDLHMPGMDGLALARELGDRAGSLIVISGSMTGDLAVKARALGVGHVLRKPFDSDLMLRCIEDALGQCAGGEPLA